jgi:ATP-dependent helicase/nuclease subunit A
VLTFTEAAANEMRTRIAEAIRAKLRQPLAGGEQAGWLRRQAAMVDRASISTLHGFCSRVLRQHFHEAQIDPNFEVIDEEEATLLREETLDELLAKWHTLPPEGERAGAFTHFFEAYAGGRDSTCREIILTLHEMLASTANREEYLARARQVYAPGGDGCEKTFGLYLEGVCRRLRLLAGTARRACTLVKRVAGDGAMLEHLCKMREHLEAAHGLLCERGIDGWDLVRQGLDFKWPTCKTLKDVEDFDGLKKMTWEAVKEGMAKLRTVTLAPDPRVMLKELGTLGTPLETMLTLAQEFDAAFTAAKRAQHRVDFNDLERLTLTLLTRSGGLAAEELRKRYHFLLVDEVQDINPLQWTLLEAVRSPVRFEGEGNLFMVGDVKQSIYGFRLAEPGLFLKREREWRAAGVVGEGDGEAGVKKYVSLPHNFRSQAKLLGTLNGFFERLLTREVAGVDYGDGHSLQPGTTGTPAAADGAPKPFDGAPVELHLVTMDREEEESGDEATDKSVDRSTDEEGGASENLSAVEHEARLVADRIAALLAEGRSILQKDGTPRVLGRKDIAILLRGMKNKAMIFARALARRGIPAHADLSTGYFDTPEVQDTLALLQVLDNPQQDIPLATVMLGPFGNFSHDDLGRIRLTYDRREVPFAEAAARYPRDGVMAGGGGVGSASEAEMYGEEAGASEACTTKEHRGVQDYAPDAPPFSEDLASRLRFFFERLAGWRELLHARPLHEGLADIYAESKILVYVAGMEAGAQRVANLQMLHQRALKFASFRKQGLHRFLRFIDKLREGDGDLGEAPILSEASDVVRIMSVHKSKGLEFPVVFVSGLGTKLQLRPEGPVLVHRDLGVGLEVADIERNVIYPSAASASIVEATGRSNRAEELRLLYVAMTRARDHLILTGHIAKEKTLEKLRRQWAVHDGPLPEDVLLKAGTPLEWLLPAVSCGEGCGGNAPLQVKWDGKPEADTQVCVTLHAPGEAETAPAEMSLEGEAAERARRVERIVQGKPLEENREGSEPRGEVARVLERVTGRYAHAAAAQEPAVRTVTFLKTIEATGPHEEAAEAPMPELEELASLQMPDEADLAMAEPAKKPKRGALPAAGAGTGGERARLRGVATHRVLELLDLARCDSAAAIDAQLGKLAEDGTLAVDERERADVAGVHWALLESAAGRRLVRAAQAGAKNLRAGPQVRRELPFTWAAPLHPGDGEDPADWPTIRGVIDALVVDPVGRTAEVFDYKTDSAFLVDERLEDYTRQMRYYLRAASEILGFEVEKATLLFLAAQREVEVRLEREQDGAAVARQQGRAGGGAC